MTTNDKGYQRKLERREFIRKAGAGTLIVAMGGMYRLAGETLNQKLQTELRSDGKKRLPPGQRMVESLRHMGGFQVVPALKIFGSKCMVKLKILSRSIMKI